MCVMFVLGGVVSLVLVLYFLVGVAAQRLVCDPLTYVVLLQRDARALTFSQRSRNVAVQYGPLG